jgi:hypothetical protein
MIKHSVEDLPWVRDTLVVWQRVSGGLQAISLGGFQSRHDAVLDLLEQVDREHVLPEFGPVLVHTLDRPVSTVEQPWRSYAFCTADGYLDVPVPDFVFGGWPEVGIDDFEETCWTVQSAGDQPAQLPVTGWIGSLQTHPVRTVLQRLGQEHPDLLDVQHVDWVADPARGALQSAAGNALTLEEQARRWSALLDVEGKGYSGRLKLLLHSGRPVLVQDRPWREWFWDSLVPMEHYVPVRRDLSDLVTQARWVQQHPHEAADIGRAGQKLARQLLTRRSAAEQWSRVLTDAAAQPRDGWAPVALQTALQPVLRRLGVDLSEGAGTRG